MKASYEVAKGLLNLLILDALERTPQTAYQLQHSLNEAIGVLFSPSLIYARLYKFEREGTINQHEKAFTITEHGKETLKQHVDTLEKIREHLYK